MTRIPREKAWDSTLALLADGYTFISERCRRHGSDVFETRLMLQPVFCMLGEEAARVFYEPDRLTRVGVRKQSIQISVAFPEPICRAQP
jgi:fatty-acid peroxygenase